jgi:hypothetical protein|tara:strand:+ start:1472 stop:1639 length:168 start_codon:yes stop_codon:yes gene_type:complete
MPSFDKFIKDLEKRQKEKIARNQIKQQDIPCSTRQRVHFYAEKWQNSIKYSGEKK